MPTTAHDQATAHGPARLPIVSVRGISKTFGTVSALRDVAMDFYPATVTALVGDNGAGKSTLVKIIAGVEAPDSGTIEVSGKRVSFQVPGDAQDLGIHVVYQDLALAENLSAAENIFLGREARLRIGRVKTPFLAKRLMREQSASTLQALGMTTIRSVDQDIERMSGGQRQTVAIARAIREDPKLIILDEPTAALGVRQTKRVAELTQQLKDTGASVLLISHNMNEVFETCDRIVALHMGTVMRHFTTATCSQADVVSAIMGVS